MKFSKQVYVRFPFEVTDLREGAICEQHLGYTVFHHTLRGFSTECVVLAKLLLEPF